MSTFTKICLSGAANGLPVKVVATASTGTTIHTAIAGTSSFDEIWLWAINTAATDVLLTVQWGGTTSPDDDIIYTVSSKDGLKCIIPGLPLQNGLIVAAYAGSANVIQMHGFANRIVP
jgi:hypothetical protein